MSGRTFFGSGGSSVFNSFVELLIPESGVLVTTLGSVREDPGVPAHAEADDDAANTPADEAAKLGRPRDPSRDAAILTATLDLLGEVSYDQVTVRAIARRSGTGLATIYRRWPTKEELVVDAVASFNEPPPEHDPGGDPTVAAIAMVTRFSDIMSGRRRELFPNLIGQVPINPALATALRAKVIEPRLELLADLLSTATGADPARARRSAELIPATLFFNILIMGRTVSDEDVRHAVDAALRAARD